MSQIAGLWDSRQAGPPADVGVFEFPASILVFQHTFAGTAYVCAVRAGERGWVLVDYGTDASTVIQSGINALPGTLVTRGEGETWTIDSTIDLVSDLTWYSDWSLTLKARDALNDPVIKADTKNNIILDGLHIDGNKANQGTPNAVRPGGIELEDCSNWKILNCYIYQTRQYGIYVLATSSDFICDGEIRGCVLDGNSWNGMNIGWYANNVVIHVCFIKNSSDFGIAVVHSDNVIVGDCIARDITGSDGSTNSNCGFSTEQTSSYCRFETCYSIDNPNGFALTHTSNNNWFSNCIVRGATTASLTTADTTSYNHINDCEFSESAKVYIQGSRHTIRDNEFYNVTYTIAEWQSHLQLAGTRHIVQDNRIIDTTGAANRRGLQSGASYTNIRDNEISINSQVCILLTDNADNSVIVGNRLDNTVSLGLQLNAGADNCWVDGNDFIGCVTDVNDLAVGTQYGYNRDQAGNWDEGIEP